MPIYEYLCQSCGKKFEVLQKFSDEPLRTHEECGGQVERLISASALQFKGSGWYVNDYAKGAASGKPAETKVDSKAGESKSETKTESKPASTESKPAAAPAPASSDSK